MSDPEQDKSNRRSCAKYLRMLAEMVDGENCDGFDIAWSSKRDTPVGQLVIDAQSLRSSESDEFLDETKEVPKPLDSN